MMQMKMYEKIKKMWENNLKKDNYEFFIGYEDLGNVIYFLIAEEYRTPIGFGEYSCNLYMYPTSVLLKNQDSFDERLLLKLDLPEELCALHQIYRKFLEKNKFEISKSGNDEFHKSFLSYLKKIQVT